MCRRKRIIIGLLIICFVAMSVFLALVVSGCSSKKFNGKYIFGTANGRVSSYLSINSKTVTLVSKTETAEYTFKSSDNQITLNTGVKLAFAEGGDVVYMPQKLQWANGYTNSSSLFGPLRQRDGYFSQIFSTEIGGVVVSEIVFSKEGTFGMTTYSNNQISGYSVGTYEFKSGLLTMNDRSTGTVEKTFLYVDDNYNIYVTAGVKETSKLYTFDNNISDDNHGGDVDNKPDTPNVPDEPVTPDEPVIPPVQDCTLTYTAGVGGRIIGALSQTVEGGKDGTSVIAIPDGGYEFIGWSDGVNTAERQDKNVIKNITVTAYFERSERLVLNGAGTEDNPYQISSAYLLNKISEYPQAHFILTQDIVLNSVEDGKSNFTPMFSDDNMFNGVLDGDGHKIVNLTIYKTSTFYTGLFACIGESGCVKNLILENVNLQGTNYIGAVAGYSLGVIENCTVNGEINYLSENSYKVFVGGIVGRIENKIDKCIANISINCYGLNGESCIGGVAGYVFSAYYDSYSLKLISNGDMNCEISDASDADLYVGGLVGYISDYIELYESFSTCLVKSNGNQKVDCGGLIGRSSEIKINNCYTIGDITASSSNYTVAVGGLLGEPIGKVTLENSFTTGDLTASGDSVSYCGGLVGYSGRSGRIIIDNCYKTGSLIANTVLDTALCGGFVGYGDITIYNSYFNGDVTADTSDSAARAGGFLGFGSATINNSYTTGYVTIMSVGRHDAIGGFVGYGDNITINNSYTTSIVMAMSDNRYAMVYAGGFAGYGYDSTISNSYTTGDITVNGKNEVVYASEFIGHCYRTINVTSSYTVSKINVTSEGTVYSGAFAGYTESFKMTNAHWLYYADSGVEYAIGYGSSMGIPSSIGATKHVDISDFYTLAEALNNGLDIPLWENKGLSSLLTLKEQIEEI